MNFEFKGKFYRTIFENADFVYGREITNGKNYKLVRKAHPDLKIFKGESDN